MDRDYNAPNSSEQRGYQPPKHPNGGYKPSPQPGLSSPPDRGTGIQPAEK